MGLFCDRLKLGSAAALNCQTGQYKGRYCEKVFLFLLISLGETLDFNISGPASCEVLIQALWRTSYLLEVCLSQFAIKI